CDAVMTALGAMAVAVQSHGCSPKLPWSSYPGSVKRSWPTSGRSLVTSPLRRYGSAYLPPATTCPEQPRTVRPPTQAASRSFMTFLSCDIGSGHPWWLQPLHQPCRNVIVLNYCICWCIHVRCKPTWHCRLTGTRQGSELEFLVSSACRVAGGG